MARKKRQVILPPTHVGAQPPRIASSAPGGSVANHVGPILEGFKISAAGAMKIADDAARVVYLKSLSKLAGLLEQEVSAVRKGLGSAQRSDIESFQKDIAARTVLLNRKTIDLGKQQKLANSYYGSSPFGKSAGYYAAATFQNIATGRIKVSNTQEPLNAAYRAAYTVQLREAEIKMLQAQISALQQALNTAQEQLRVEAEAQARARQKAEAQARARQEAGAAARAKAEVEAVAKAKAEAEAAIQAEAQAQATRLANTFTMSGTATFGGPLVVTAVGHVVSTALNISLSASIGAALAALRGAAGSVAVPFVAGVAALLYSSRLGNGELPERYVLQMPLEMLDPQIDLPLAPGNAIGSHAELPYRFSSHATEAGDSEILVIKTEGQVVPSQVRVLAATHDRERNLYNATTADVPTRTLTWTPIAQPANASTGLPAERPEAAIYEGATLTPVEVRIDGYPSVADASLDDYIIVFPADSGLPPLYVMFKDRREEPGTMNGFGQPDATVWLAGANQGQGVAIPPRIADKLRGRNFSSWRRAREAIWIAVSEDPILISQFSKSNQALLRNGYAPSAIPREHAGSNRAFEIHHVIPLRDGGAVYDIDNLRITTPKNHVRIHRNKGADK
ncbi:hypothetical protein QFZ86_001601 [Pseudomonas plecoglossicida]